MSELLWLEHKKNNSIVLQVLVTKFGFYNEFMFSDNLCSILDLEENKWYGKERGHKWIEDLPAIDKGINTMYAYSGVVQDCAVSLRGLVRIAKTSKYLFHKVADQIQDKKCPFLTY